MAMYRYIRTWYPEKEVKYLEEIPNSFRFIEATKEISDEIKEKTYQPIYLLRFVEMGAWGFQRHCLKMHRKLYV